MTGPTRRWELVLAARQRGEDIAAPSTAADLAAVLGKIPPRSEGGPELSLWDRLVAQEGYDRAGVLWGEACDLLDAQ